MLGFSPLSTNPFSAISDIIVKLESEALLDSFSIIDFSSIIKLLSNSTASVAAELFPAPNNISRVSSELRTESLLYPNTLIKIPNSSVFLNSSAVSVDYLSRITIRSNLDIDSRLELNSYLSNKSSALLSNKSEISSFAKIVFQSSSEFTESSLLSGFGSVKLQSFGEFTSDYNLISDTLLRAVGNINLTSVTGFDVGSFIKTHVVSNLIVDSEIFVLPSAKFFNSSNFEIIGILSGNISQVNRDIVYYILYIDKTKSLDLYIAKAK